MALEQLVTIRYGIEMGIRHSYLNNTNKMEHFQNYGHNWSFHAWMRARVSCQCGDSDPECKDTLNMTLTYNGTNADKEEIVEVFGRIYSLDKHGNEAGFLYQFTRRRFGPEKREFRVEHPAATRTILPLQHNKSITIRIQLYYVRNAYIPTDYKVLKPYANFAVVVGETKFYVSKEILASLSPVFASMFSDEKDEKSEITLSDVTSAEFEELLKVMQPGSRMEFSRTAAMGAVKVAQKYRMESIVAMCAQRLALCCNDKMSAIDRKMFFNTANAYGLVRLQRKIVATCPLDELRCLVDDNPSNPQTKGMLKMVMDRLVVERGAPGTVASDGSSLPAIDFKTPKPFANFVITVNGTKMYASREVLASASSVFAAMLYGNFEEAKKNEIEIEDSSVEIVELLLALIQPGSRMTVNDQHVMGLLKLANKYLFESVIMICDDILAADYLGEKSLVANQQCLVLASEYHLRGLATFSTVGEQPGTHEEMTLLFLIVCNHSQTKTIEVSELSVFASRSHSTELRALLDNGQIDSLPIDVLKVVVDRLWSCAETAVKKCTA